MGEPPCSIIAFATGSTTAPISFPKKDGNQSGLLFYQNPQGEARSDEAIACLLAFWMESDSTGPTHPLSPSKPLTATSSSFSGTKEAERQASFRLPILDPSMGTSAGCFGRRRSVHEILGGGIIADVMLWRRRDVTAGILLGTLAAWVVFVRSRYNLLSLVSNVLLLLISLLFVWAKAAAILNRPLPPIPEMHLSEEVINQVAIFVHSLVDMVLSVFHNIALGKDLNLFYRVAICLLLISIIGSLTDFLTLGYTSLVIILTVPALYEKYEDCVDRYAQWAYIELLMYERVYAKYFSKARNWILEKKKLL